MKKLYILWFQKTLVLSEHACCVFIIGQHSICRYYKQSSTTLAMTS